MDDAKEDAQLNDLKPMVEMLLDLSATFVENSGNFLPHGAVLAECGDLKMVSGAPEHDETNSVEVLPILHEGLRDMSASGPVRAVAVSESVYIGPKRTPAIKVLAEHRDGLTVAFYQTWKKPLFAKVKFDEILTSYAEPEVKPWG